MSADGMRSGPFALVVAGALLFKAAMVHAALVPGAQTSARDESPRSAARHPDLSGVWERRETDGRGFDASVQDLDDERPPFRPLWAQQWRRTRERARAGMRVWDPNSRCLPPGMPRTMNATYPFEVLVTPGRLTILTEYFNETRRIWTDGRSHPGPDDLELTFSGHSIGHWEGETLIIDTVGLRPETVIDVGLVPHSDRLHVVERVRKVGPNELAWQVTLEDPVVFSAPWSTTKHFFRSPADGGVREFVCTDNNKPDIYKSSLDDDQYTAPDPRLKTLP